MDRYTLKPCRQNYVFFWCYYCCSRIFCFQHHFYLLRLNLTSSTNIELLTALCNFSCPILVFFCFCFCLFICFLKLKMYILIHIRLLDYAGGKWLKNFHPADFRKQDYIFWPEYNVWNQHWIGSYLIEGYQNTLIYFKSKSSYSF